MWSLATEPTQRPQTANAFAVALAERATAAFGSGWLARTGLRASVGSRIAALTVVDCLYIAVAQRDLPRARKHVADSRKAVAGHHVL